jgi:hypothetical protein
MYYEEYNDKYRLGWYNIDSVLKQSIIEKYKKGEFENKTSFTKYEFYRFQSLFTEDEISFIGF